MFPGRISFSNVSGNQARFGVLATSANTFLWIRYRAVGTSSWATAISNWGPLPFGSGGAVFVSPLIANAATEIQFSSTADYSAATTTTFTIPASFIGRVSVRAQGDTVTFTIGSHGSPIYQRYRKRGTSNWISFTGSTLGPLSFGTYDYQISVNSDYSGSRTGDFKETVVGSFTVQPTTLGTPTVAVSNFEATISVRVSNAPVRNINVYARYRLRGTVNWTPLASQTVSSSNSLAAFSVTLPASGTYEYQVSLNSDYSSPQSGTITQSPTTLGAPTVEVSGLDVSISVTVANISSRGANVYARYRRRGLSDWTTLASQGVTPESPTAGFLATLGPGTYDYQVSLNADYSDSRSGTFTIADPKLGTPAITAVSGSTATISVDVTNGFSSDVYLRLPGM